MKALATFLLMLSIPNPQIALPSRSLLSRAGDQRAPKGGQWYLAENGHAVYCYGPVMLIKDRDGNPQRVATFCKGDRTIVPLHD